MLVHHGPLFALGVLIWATWQRGFTIRRGALAALFIAGSLLQITARAGKMAAQTDDPALWWPAPLAWLIAIAAIVLAIRHPAGGRTTRMIGLATYPLYLAHQVLGAALMGVLIRAGAPPYLALALVLVAITAIAWTVAALAEPPMRAALTRAIDRIVAGPPRPDPRRS